MRSDRDGVFSACTECEKCRHDKRETERKGKKDENLIVALCWYEHFFFSSSHLSLSFLALPTAIPPLPRLPLHDQDVHVESATPRHYRLVHISRRPGIVTPTHSRETIGATRTLFTAALPNRTLRQQWRCHVVKSARLGRRLVDR